MLILFIPLFSVILIQVLLLFFPWVVNSRVGTFHVSTFAQPIIYHGLLPYFITVIIYKTVRQLR